MASHFIKNQRPLLLQWQKQNKSKTQKLANDKIWHKDRLRNKTKQKNQKSSLAACGCLQQFYL